jgi:hypothetical protein
VSGCGKPPGTGSNTPEKREGGVYGRWRYDETVPAETPRLPVIPHWKAGVKCNGSIIPEQNGDQITLKCNECGSVVGTINAAILSALEQAIADAFVFQSSGKWMRRKF